MLKCCLWLGCVWLCSDVRACVCCFSLSVMLLKCCGWVGCGVMCACVCVVFRWRMCSRPFVALVGWLVLPIWVLADEKSNGSIFWLKCRVKSESFLTILLLRWYASLNLKYQRRENQFPKLRENTPHSPTLRSSYAILMRPKSRDSVSFEPSHLNEPNETLSPLLAAL